MTTALFLLRAEQDKGGDLNRRPDRDTDTQVHLDAVCKQNGRNLFCHVGTKRDNDMEVNT